MCCEVLTSVEAGVNKDGGKMMLDRESREMVLGSAEK
jgi:hypothetical protein